VTSWFSKKKAPDGTLIIRHDAIERQMGFTGEDAAGFRQTREAAYERIYGKPESVFHEVLPQVPHIDVYTIKRILKRSSGDEVFYVLMTGGMSDLAMTMPRNAKDLDRRVELIFYCAEPREEYVTILRWVAHFPHDSKSWLGHGHTVPNGNPPEPFWGSDKLDTLFFLPPIIAKDQKLPSELRLNGEPVNFLWVVPITTAECNFKLNNGFDALMDLFDQNQHPYIFDPKRRSYV
jgi:hypothetical protein